MKKIVLIGGHDLSLHDIQLFKEKILIQYPDAEISTDPKDIPQTMPPPVIEPLVFYIEPPRLPSLSKYYPSDVQVLETKNEPFYKNINTKGGKKNKRNKHYRK